MVAALFTVLLGTIYPLILEAITSEKISVGPPYFNFVFNFVNATCINNCWFCDVYKMASRSI